MKDEIDNNEYEQEGSDYENEDYRDDQDYRRIAGAMHNIAQG